MKVKEMIEQLQEIAGKYGDDLQVSIITKNEAEDVEKVVFNNFDWECLHAEFIIVYGKESWEERNRVLQSTPESKLC